MAIREIDFSSNICGLENLREHQRDEKTRAEGSMEISSAPCQAPINATLSNQTLINRLKDLKKR